jgi:probable F420-dependent oxidoreductase
MPASIVPAGTLAYGIQLPVQQLSGSIREAWEPDAGVDDIVAVAKAADDAGCAFVGVCDHVALPHNDYTAHMSTTWYDTVATLGYVAAHTRRARLLSVVYIAAYRHPLVTAKAFLTIDKLSGGRAVLGVGAGHVETEFRALGIDFASRGARTNEAVDAIRNAFASEYSSFHGEFFDYADVGLSPRPARGEGTIPIWIGGSSRAALRRVAERGDGWIPQGTPRAQMRACVDTIRARLDEVRPGTQLDLGFMPEYLYLGEPAWDTGGRALTGSPEKIAASLREAYDLGCNVLHLHFRSRDRHELCDQLAEFGRDVAPLLAR